MVKQCGSTISLSEAGSGDLNEILQNFFIAEVKNHGTEYEPDHFVPSFRSRYSIGKDKEFLEKQENGKREGHCTLGTRQREAKKQSRPIKVRGRAPVEEGC